ncbi:UxaA family hydrolase [Rhodobacteraceae bacterium]|nr:UxaA family hydrolase [Paracoccaceae bacterium]
MENSDPRLLHLSEDDNVMVLRETIHRASTMVVAGHSVMTSHTLGMGHKIACRGIQCGDPILKYGMPIGFATTDIAIGDHVHLHNITSGYTPTHALDETATGAS